MSRASGEQEGFVRSVELARERVRSFDVYPYGIPAVRALGGRGEGLALDRRVTFLIGENGSGKSTLLEAIAIASGFDPGGGTKNFRTSTRRTESNLEDALRLVRSARREKGGFFMRAETTFQLATYIDEVGAVDAYGGRSLHERSHGEAFLTLAHHRFRDEGLYLLDEPEAALSPSRQLAFLRIVDDLARRGRSQFVIATHSPILSAYPGALLYQLDPAGIRSISYEESEPFQVTRDFLANRHRYLEHLFKD